MAATVWRRNPWLSFGAWAVLILAAYLAFSAGVAVLDPVYFATRLGLPLADAADSGFVLVYASRTAFLVLFALAMLVRRDIEALAVFALIAVIIPLADAIVTAKSGAPVAIVARHLGAAVFLAVTAFLLRRWVRGNTGSS
jgi:hypothetical protein